MEGAAERTAPARPDRRADSRRLSVTRIVRASNPKSPSPARASRAQRQPQPQSHVRPQPIAPTPSLRPYARGVASGMLFMGLLGCLPETPKTSYEPALQPRDVRVQLPSQALARSDDREKTAAAADAGDPTDRSNADAFAPRAATMEDLGAWMASSAQDAPRRLEEINRKAREANADLARRQQAKEVEPPTQAGDRMTPIAEPDPAPPVLARPAAPPVVAPVASPATVAPVEAASTSISSALTPAVTDLPSPSSPARVLAAAMGEAIAKHAQASELSRPVTQAVADAIGAISDPSRPFQVSDYPGLDEDEAIFVTRLHEASAEVGRDLASGKPLGEAVAKLADAIKAVEPAKPLLVRRSEFATRVDGFGQLQPITNRRFLPGRQNQIILYNELDGFTSERSEKGEWTTTLATRIQILAKHDGTEVWSRNWLAVTDTSTVRREDFFVCEKVLLSEYLTVGTYILKTSVRDERTGAIAERSVEFSMVADPALAVR
jgi:hypothetical protein